MQVGDHVTVQGMPGTVVQVDLAGPSPLYLVLLSTPSIRWLPASVLNQPMPGAAPGPIAAGPVPQPGASGPLPPPPGAPAVPAGPGKK